MDSFCLVGPHTQLRPRAFCAPFPTSWGRKGKAVSEGGKCWRLHLQQGSCGRSAPAPGSGSLQGETRRGPSHYPRPAQKKDFPDPKSGEDAKKIHAGACFLDSEAKPVHSVY